MKCVSGMTYPCVGRLAAERERLLGRDVQRKAQFTECLPCDRRCALRCKCGHDRGNDDIGPPGARAEDAKRSQKHGHIAEHGNLVGRGCDLRRLSTLAIGSHTIRASYGGSATFASSTSPSLAQTIDVPIDRVRLRALQLNVTKVAAQTSGQAISGAIDAAIADSSTMAAPS